MRKPASRLAAGPATRGNPRGGRRLPPEKRILNRIPSSATEKDWRLEDAQAAGVVGGRRSLPSSVDLRARWWGIGDQAETGACVGWSVADSVTRWHFVKLGRLSRGERLSERYVWMAAKETDAFVTRPTGFIEQEGTSIKAALDVARKFGVVTEAMLPFVSGQLYAGNTSSFYALAAQRKITSYFNLGSDVAAWRHWLATEGPIAIGLDVDTTWDAAGTNRGKLDVYHARRTRGGHAAALVGYTPSRFIVRNSWGTTWGDGGFGYASIAYARAAFREAYGVKP